jgi:hypothetical protein
LYLDALKNQVKRPRNRVYSAQGVKDIMKLCRDMVDKPDVHVNWKRLISKYNEDHELVNSDSEDDDDSDTGSMDGLGKFFNIQG